MTLRLSIERRDLHRTRWDESPARALDDGEVRLRIERIALTANNITYAAFGDAMRYWDFFPTGDAATGCLPVWGFAEVAESRHEAVQPGERVYGYFPLADELSERERLAIGLTTLATRERDLIPEYGNGILSVRNLDAMMRNTGHMIDAARKEARIPV